MSLLLIHADLIAYEVFSNTKIAETDFVQKDVMHDVIVAFCAVGVIDEEEPTGIATQSAEEITAVAGEMGIRVNHHPRSTHSCSNLAKSQMAVTIMKSVALTAARTLEVRRAPFGCYKKFTITCKAHPLSELSRKFFPPKTGNNE